MSLFELITDPYERKARVTPGLLVSLPVLVPLLCVYGPKHPILTALLGLLAGCGAIYALGSVARVRGKRLEERLVRRWGGMPTTLALRHRDTFLDNVSKQHIHAFVQKNLGIKVPSADEERASPEQADDVYIGATRRMRELTRSDKRLLRENIAYGFHRNMVAMKRVGIFTCLIGFAYGLNIEKVLMLNAPYVVPENLRAPSLAAALTLFISAVLLLAWLFHFNADAVRGIGFSYAERLFEAATGATQPKTRKPRSKAPD